MWLSLVTEQMIRCLAFIVRSVPINRRKGVFIRLSACLDTKLSFSFYSRKLGIRWSAKGFPDLLTRHMLFEGMYQQDVLVAIKRVIRPGDVVIDIGGHHGLMAVIASSATGSQGLVV